MRALLLVLVSSAALAQPAAQVPWMTGERLVKLLGNVDPTKVTWSEDSPFRSRAIAADYIDMANGRFVSGYIQAVHDATEGKEWCWSERYRPKPDELEADARAALQRMPADQLKRGASALIAEVWAKKWPCRRAP